MIELVSYLHNHINISLAINAQGSQHLSDLNKIRDSLFPNLPTFLGHLVATVILLFVIVRFLYTPFRQSQTRKHDYLTKVIASANEKLISAEIKKDKIVQELEAANEKCDELIQESREKADYEKKVILDLANKKRNKIIQGGEVAVQAERQKMQSEIKEQIVDTAFIIASKISNKDLNTKTNSQLVDDYINDELRSQKGVTHQKS